MKDWKQIYKKGKVQIEPSKQIARLVPIYKAERIERILDHGCGTGRHIKYLAERGFYVIGTDYSEEALIQVRKLTNNMNNIELVQACMNFIPYDNEYFDAIISSHTIQHGIKKERDGAFQELTRTLRKHGLLFLRTISRNHRIYGKGKEIEPHTFIDIQELPDGKNPHHYFSEGELKKYLEEFEILEFQHHSTAPNTTGFWTKGLEEWAILARRL